MKRTIILLEEDLLLEVQQLAKEQQITTSQVIQQAVANYVQGQRQSRSSPPALEEEFPQIEPSEPLVEPVQPVEEEKLEPVLAEHQPAPAQGIGVEAKRLSWLTLISLILGGLSGLFALLQFLQAAGQLTGHAQPLEVVINYLVPGILLGIVAAAFCFIASQGRRSRATY